MIKILIVDDEKPICDLIDMNLSAAGYFCKTVQDGLKAIDFYDMPKALPEYKIVINTVPALVLKEEGIRQLPPDACIIDIASKPGGTDFEAAEKYGIAAKLALGLPGIYTTSSSAMLLKNAILKFSTICFFIVSISSPFIVTK